MELTRNTYVEVDNQIIEANARAMVTAFPHKVNIAVIKGNAYGHGYGVVPALVRGGMNAFAVSRLWEALEVRKYNKDYPVIMLQPVHCDCLKVCSDNNISICVNDIETLDEILACNLPLKLHIKVDSGMNRLGFKDRNELSEAYRKIKACDNLYLEGIFTHFHTSGVQDTEYERNLNTFCELTRDIDLSQIPIVHVDRTQTAILHETPSFANAARIGIALFGFTTVSDFPNTLKGRIRKIQRNIKNKKNHVKPCRPIVKPDVKMAYKLVTEVLQVKKVNPGEYVGYGLFHKAENFEYVATIDIGYADGIGRRRHNSYVAINGRKYKIVADVGMGMCEVIVDETVKRHDLVTVIGGDLAITDVTFALNTTVYEAMTAIDTIIPRIYTNNPEV